LGTAVAGASTRRAVGDRVELNKYQRQANLTN